MKQNIGKRGEDLAAAYLEGKGYKIIARNYWKPWGEIDLVAQKGTDLRFVEVKSVTRLSLKDKEGDYEPEDNLHPWKRKRLRRIIETYILAEDLADDIEWQVDAIAVYLNPAGELLKVEWLDDIQI